jgi:hypothetical protein
LVRIHTPHPTLTDLLLGALLKADLVADALRQLGQEAQDDARSSQDVTEGRGASHHPLLLARRAWKHAVRRSWLQVK